MLFLLGCHLCSLAQTVIIKGAVIDDKKQPIELAQIHVEGTIFGGVCDLKGHYRFRAVPLESFGAKGRAIWSDLVVVSGDEQS